MTAYFLRFPLKLVLFPLAILIAVCQYIDMVCIQCGEKTNVTNSRLKKKTNSVWRRRICLACGAIFSSIEAVDYFSSISIKKSNQSLEPFIKEDLFLSILDSCRHRKEPVIDAVHLTDTVLGRLLKEIKSGLIDSAVIKKVTLVTLNRFDKVSATYYQAFHP